MCPHHPDRTVYAKGQCRSCYEKDLRRRNPEYAERQRQNNLRWKSVPENLIRKQQMDLDRQKLGGSRAHRAHRISKKEYDEHLSRPCGICGKPSTRLDHNHTTGKIRGGLCHRCNLGLGYYEGWFVENREAILVWIEEEAHASSHQ